MKKTLFINLFLLLISSSCKEHQKSETTQAHKSAVVNSYQQSEGYKLMEQKCFICHFPVPDRSRKEKMIAPPMLRVQEHYKPAYPNKSDFVHAIEEWVKHPSEEKVQMPGAARKFEVMPYLPYTDEEIQLIAETLFEIDFGSDFKKNRAMEHGHVKKQGLKLNEGKKWQLSKEAIEEVMSISKQLNRFKSDDVKAYQELGSNVFDTAKKLILDKELESEKFEQVQVFFHNVEEDIHKLMQVKTVEEGNEQVIVLKKKFSKFSDFFDS
jgi:hypothetical protein